jgi:arylsulfatase A-like enzyme
MKALKLKRRDSEALALVAVLMAAALGDVFSADTGAAAPVQQARSQTQPAQTTAKRPNILFIPSDDLKPLLGCYGDKVIKTPNIDRVAARGLVFRNSHCQQAICGPTRASLLTGLYPDSTGVWDQVRKFRAVNPTVVTLPQYFREHGYLTANIGKTFVGRNTGPGQDRVSWSFPTAARSSATSTGATSRSRERPWTPFSGRTRPRW